MLLSVAGMGPHQLRIAWHDGLAPWVKKLDMPPFGVALDQLIRDLFGAVGIAQNVLDESNGLFLAFLEFLAGERVGHAPTLSESARLGKTEQFERI